MKNYPWKEFICLVLVPVILLLLTGIGYLFINFVHIPDFLWFIRIFFVIMMLLGISSLKYLPFYLIVIGILPFLFIIDKMIYKISVVFLVNLIFFYLLGFHIESHASKYISEFVPYYIYLSAIIYTILYIIVRLAANKIKKPAKNIED